MCTFCNSGYTVAVGVVVVSRECGDFNAPTNKLRWWTGDPKYVQGLNDTTVIVLVLFFFPSVNTKHASTRAENRIDSRKMHGLSCEWKKKNRLTTIRADRFIAVGPVGTEMLYHARCTFDVWSPTVYADRWKTSKTTINYTACLAVCWKRLAGNSRDNGDRIKRALIDRSKTDRPG